MARMTEREFLLSVWSIVGAVLVVEAAVRFVLDFNLERVLLAETISFMAAAALLTSLARRRAELSERARTSILVLSLALVLGAVRSGLWLAGLQVQWANLIILVLSLMLFTLWWRRRRMRG